MNTKSIDIDRLDRDGIEVLLGELPADKEKTEEPIVDLLKGQQDDLKEIKFVLPVPASKELCLHAAKGLRMSFDEITKSYRLKSEPLQTQLEHIIEVYNLIWKRLDVLAELEQDDEQKMLIIFTKMVQEGEFNATKDALELLTGSLKFQADILLQESLQNLVKAQDDELKRWFVQTEMGEVTSHMKISESTRPEVIVSSPTSRSPLKLPLEIMGLVYSLASLESCVALREVNKAWYLAFQNSETVMERKMKERNPWIQPGDPDLRNWADCVHVFAGRIKSGNWKSTRSIEDDLYVPYEPWVTKTVVGTPLRPDEKLPADFTGMFDPPERVRVIGSMGNEYLVDPWTLASRKINTLYEVVREDKEGLVLECQGIDITLDPSISSVDIVEVHLQERTIYVTLEDYTMVVFPRDKPHYKNSLRLDYFSEDDSPGPVLEVGDVVVHRLGLGDYEYRFSLVDFETKTTTFICDNANPAASYNGLMWVSVGGFLAPLFVDLETPGVAYYRSDRALRGIGKMSNFTQASKSRGMGQFTIRQDKSSLFLADLATGVVTTLLPPQGWRKPMIIPGFQDGIFQVRCIKNSDLKKIRRRVLCEHGVIAEGDDTEEEEGEDDEETDEDNRGWF